MKITKKVKIVYYLLIALTILSGIVYFFRHSLNIDVSHISSRLIRGNEIELDGTTFYIAKGYSLVGEPTSLVLREKNKFNENDNFIVFKSKYSIEELVAKNVIKHVKQKEECGLFAYSSHFNESWKYLVHISKHNLSIKFRSKPPSNYCKIIT